MNFKYSVITAAIGGVDQALVEITRATEQTTFTPEQKAHVHQLFDRLVARIETIRAGHTLRKPQVVSTTDRR